VREEDVCNALKNLADLKEEGYLTEAQYITEVKAVLEQAGKNGVANEAAFSECTAPDPEPNPLDLLDIEDLHGDPEDRLAHPPEEIVEAILDRADATRHDPPRIIDEPPTESMKENEPQELPPEGRVIVSGKAPWDDAQEKRFKLDTQRGTQKKDILHDKKSVYNNVILRDRLAKMAKETNRKMDIRKNELLAAGLSLILPGLGHLYLGMLGIGMGLVLIAGVLIALQFLSEESMFMVLLPVWILGALIAYKHAQNYNFLLDRKAMTRRRTERGLSVSSMEKATRGKKS
jgi:TM2 domain-containing membrane protein YozV